MYNIHNFAGKGGGMHRISFFFSFNLCYIYIYIYVYDEPGFVKIIFQLFLLSQIVDMDDKM